MGLVIYLAFTGMAGLIAMVVGASEMYDNWKYGFRDKDLFNGAVAFILGLLAPIVFPLALVAAPCVGIYAAVKVIYKNFKEG